jgi:tagatose-1,6-bisphosphate aldolase non-catalytic subunit AgaZ/GatZ
MEEEGREGEGELGWGWVGDGLGEVGFGVVRLTCSTAGSDPIPPSLTVSARRAASCAACARATSSARHGASSRPRTVGRDEAMPRGGCRGAAWWAEGREARWVRQLAREEVAWKKRN